MEPSLLPSTKPSPHAHPPPPPSPPPPPPPSSTSAASVTSQSQSQSHFGPALAVTFLLRDYEHYGLSERVRYHFHLSEVLGDSASLLAGGGIVGDSSLSAAAAKVDEETLLVRQREESRSSSNNTSPNKSEGSNKSSHTSGDRSSDPNHHNAETSKQQSSASLLQGYQCGIARVLECIPSAHHTRLSRQQRVFLKTSLTQLNQKLLLDNTNANPFNQPQYPKFACCEPSRLPVRLNASTRVSFAYETTRIVLLVDASPSMTATFGIAQMDHHRHSSGASGSSSSDNNDNDNDDYCCCPMDRLPGMARTLIHALAEKVPLPYRQGCWQPQLSISVLAVYPPAAGGGNSSRSDSSQNNKSSSSDHSLEDDRTSLLVRDWTVTDTASAETLVKHLQDWVFCTVEEEIASRIMHRQHHPMSNHNRSVEMNLDSFSDGGNNLSATSFSDWWRAGKAALDSLTSSARPCIIVATDGRSVSTDKGLDDTTLSLDETARDIPLFILDLSSSSSTSSSSPQQHSKREGGGDKKNKNHFDPLNLMQEDPGADFPLYMSDDREALYHISRTTGGCVWDKTLLYEAARTKVGQVAPDSPLAVDQYLGKLVRKHQPHMIRPNAVQWYTLFSLSPLSPTFYVNWGHLPPPAYLRNRWTSNPLLDGTSGRFDSQSVFHSQSYAGMSTTSDQYRKPSSMLSFENQQGSKASAENRLFFPDQRKNQVRVQFSTYFINPVRILGLLLMRVKEGYRAIRYGQSTHDPDKVSIIFHLPLELGTSLHYEVSYRSMTSHNHNHMIGHAHIKIELSGEASFIQAVKTDFLQHSAASHRRPVTLAQQVSAKLGRLLRSIRREDLLQSYLSPLKWSDQLSKGDAPFMRRLGTLSKLQKINHFRYDEFDCICVGRMPYAQDAGFLDAFQDVDNGEEDLLEAISAWSTRRIHSSNDRDTWNFVRKLHHGLDKLPAYCLVSVQRSHVASRLFTVSVEMFEGCNSAPRRLAVLASLREVLDRIKDVKVLDKQMGPYLMGFRRRGENDDKMQRFLASQYLHKSWDLVYDKELLPLLMRRRAEIGGFWLLDSSETYALFAKLNYKDGSRRRDDPGDMVQYQVSILAERVVVDLHMESERGVYNDWSKDSEGGQFETLAYNLTKRDQECGRALRSRTQILSVFDDEKSAKMEDAETHLASVSRLLAYTSRVEQPMRAFHSVFSGANIVLLEEIKNVLLHQQFGPRVAALSIDTSDDILESDPGMWFLVDYNKDTSGLLHLGSTVSTRIGEADGCAATTMRLTFHTLSISDLYTQREDFVGDDDSDQGTVEEYMCMTDFAEQLVKEYKYVYTRAAYKALLVNQHYKSSIHLDDLSEIMSPLSFCPVADVLIESGGEKLVRVLSPVIREIPGEKYLYFFMMDDIVEVSGDSSVFISSDDSVGDDASDFSQNSDDGGTKIAEETDVNLVTDDAILDESSSAPVFVRFLLDDLQASMSDLTNLRRSAKLVALITVYGSNPKALPLSHRTPANKIKLLLNAYVAEQTLERLRRFGPSISPDELRLARKCLRKAQDVLTSTVVLLFYSSTVDSIVSVSVPAGGDNDIQAGMKLLQGGLSNLEKLRLKKCHGGFVVLGQENSEILPYWCFLDFGNGFVTIESHHPDGPEEAKNVLTYVHGILMEQLHRVNQILILRRLHKSRSASPLMIAEDDKDLDPNKKIKGTGEEEHAVGFFACPVVFRKRFELFHRCATNPEQVARTVETSVLHIFSIANRRRVFVYKDESGSIFYMRLVTAGGGLEPDGTIDLVVHGLDEPTESVTKQLSRLISKKILSIAVDLLAAVLTKNPRYAWRVPDVNFVMQYNQMWSEVEDGAVDSGPQNRYYSYPVSVSDPGAILFYFRQNLCGSTYFHTFVANNARDEDGDQNENLSFTFYYNNYPSKLSPKLQGRSTLTKKGADFARMAGQGLALIEVSLVNSLGMQSGAFLPTGSLTEIKSMINVDAASIQTKIESLGKEEISVGNDRLRNHFVKVKITDTSLRRQVLHDWIELTLNQVTMEWIIERHCERQQRGLLMPFSPKVDLPAPDSTTKLTAIDQIIIGLPSLISMFENAYKLPHPAAQKVSFDGVVRSSSVAFVAMKLLEMILEPIRRETKGASKIDFFGSVHIIRLSRSLSPTKVKLSWGRGKRVCLVHPCNPRSGPDGDKPIEDSHIECPEYLIYFSSPEYDESVADAFAFPKLFEDVEVGEEYHNDPQIARLKKENPNLFRRSFSFVLSVKRNRRFFLSYNWRPDLFTTVVSSIKDVDADFLEAARCTNNGLQRRSLSFLSPSIVPGEDGRARAKKKSENDAKRRAAAKEQDARQSKSNNDEKNVQQSKKNATQAPSKEQSHRAVRPVSIRRPKLVGKSVDGSAAHAVAASRARAAFKGSQGSSANVPGPKAPPNAGAQHSRGPLGTRKPRDNRQTDDNRRSQTHEGKRVGKLVKEFRSKLIGDSNSIRRHTLHQEASKSFFASFWPLKSNMPPLTVGGEFLLEQATFDFVSTVELLPFPGGMLDSFTTRFASFLKETHQGLRVVGTNKYDASLPQAVFLNGKIRKMQGLRCLPIFQVDMIRNRETRRLLLRCTAWTVVLSRTARKPNGIFRSRDQLEMKSNGPDKLLSVVRSQVAFMESKMVEFTAMITMQVLRQCDLLPRSDAVNLMFDLIGRYDLARQIRMLRSDYKFFRVPLILKSFGNSNINHFEAPVLFSWLVAQSDSRDLCTCGSKSLVLSNEIDSAGVKAIAVLTDTGEADKMDLALFCYAKSVDLQQFMFRSDSNVAVTVAKNLAIEAAGLALDELIAASTSLRRNSLWSLAERSHSHRKNSDSIMDELLGLCVLEPLEESANCFAYEQLLNRKAEISWKEMCDCMSLEEAFSPSWTLVDGRKLFYMRKFDIFLLMTLTDESHSVSFVLKSTDSTSYDEKVAATQQLLNFFLHFLWSTLAVDT